MGKSIFMRTEVEHDDYSEIVREVYDNGVGCKFVLFIPEDRTDFWVRLTISKPFNLYDEVPLHTTDLYSARELANYWITNILSSISVWMDGYLC